MIEICTQQLVLQVLQRGTSIPFSTPTEKKEKKKRKKHNSLVFLCLSSTSLAKTFFVRLWLSWATKYLVSLIPTFLKTTVGVPTYLGEHRPFQITVHMCRKHEFSGLYCVNVQLNFFKTKLYRPKGWSTTADRALARGTLKGNIYKVRQWTRQQFQDFLFLSIGLSLNVLPLGTM